MPDMREGGLGTAACYLTVERLALQAGVESPFWDETSLLMGGCEEPWYKKPLTPRRLRSFLKRYGGSLPDDDGQRGHAASVFADVMRLHGIPMEDGADNLGALYVRRAESVGMTVAFLATGCTLADLDAFFESNGCGWLRQSIGIGSWRGDAGEDEKAARIIRASLEQHGLTLERARARYGKRRVSEARKWAETVAFFATGCSFLDIAEVVDRSVAQVSKEIYDTWCKDYYIGCVDNICKLAFVGYLVREQGLDEDGVEPGEVIVLEEYMDGETQELRSLGTSDVHGV